jgi:hypothetical protein
MTNMEIFYSTNDATTGIYCTDARQRAIQTTLVTQLTTQTSIRRKPKNTKSIYSLLHSHRFMFLLYYVILHITLNVMCDLKLNCSI